MISLLNESICFVYKRQVIHKSLLREGQMRDESTKIKGCPLGVFAFR